MKQSDIVRDPMRMRGALLFFVIVSMGWIGIWQAGRVSANSTLNVSTAAASSCPAGKYCSFIPLVNAPNPGDLVLSGIEVTQAVQNTQNSIHLVAGKKTILRIYTNTRDLQKAVPNVKVTIKASNSSNILLSDSPKTYYATVPLSSSRGNYKSSINISLPAAWLTGSVDLTVKLDPDNSIRETNDNNNSIMQHLVFHEVPPLQVTIVPILYHHEPDGLTYPAPSSDTVSDWIRRTYPISTLELTWHAPYRFTGDLSTAADFSRLLNEISTVKSTEGAPESQVYYGLIPTTDGSSTWFYGGYAGLGWVGSRAAIGLDFEDQTSQLAAHEIGHNLGMWHTPCGGASGIEPGFPYADGTIGQYGLDVTNGVVYSPSNKDVMSYCSPKWVSDYSYEKFYTGQVQLGASMAMSLTAADPAAGGSQRGLLVRANIGANGVELLPAYVLPGQVRETPEAGEYLVEVLGEQGEIITQAPVRAYQAMEDGEIQITSIHAMIALPDQPAARLRLLKDGQVLAEQGLEKARAGQVAAVRIEPLENGYRLRWDKQQSPALIRFTMDGGKTWTTLGVDVTGEDLSLPVSAPKDAAFEVIPAGNWK